MNRRHPLSRGLTTAVLASLGLAGLASAQVPPPMPPSPPDGPRAAPADAPNPPGPGGPRGEGERPKPPPGPGQGGPGQPGPGGRPGGPGDRLMMVGHAPGPMAQFEIFRAYMGFAEQYARFVTNPSAAGVSAVVTASEILKPRGTDAAIAYFTKLLPEVKNGAVGRAIRLQLIDLYRKSGQADKALDELRNLMIEAPAGEPARSEADVLLDRAMLAGEPPMRLPLGAMVVRPLDGPPPAEDAELPAPPPAEAN